MKKFPLILQTATAIAVLCSTASLPAIAQVPGGVRPTPGVAPPYRPTPGMAPPTVAPPVPGGVVPGRLPVPSAAPPTVGTPGNAVVPGRPPMVPPTAGTPGTMPGGSAVASGTTFLCGQSGSNPATLVQVGGRTLQAPLIVWTTNYFGANYTPQQRCQMVSARLTSAVAQNGGRLSNLRLSSGSVNNETVVCVTNGYGTCAASNMLFTLRPENARNSQDVLARLVEFGRLGSGSPVYESGGLGGATADPSVDLEEAVNLALQEESGGLAPNYTAEPAYDPNAVPQGGYEPNAGYPVEPGYAPAPVDSDPGYYPGGI